MLIHPVSSGCNFIDLQGVLQPVAGEFRLEVVFLLTGRAIPRYFVFVLWLRTSSGGSLSHSEMFNMTLKQEWDRRPAEGLPLRQIPVEGVRLCDIAHTEFAAIPALSTYPLQFQLLSHIRANGALRAFLTRRRGKTWPHPYLVKSGKLSPLSKLAWYC
jgi:hypothetical protein